MDDPEVEINAALIRFLMKNRSKGKEGSIGWAYYGAALMRLFQVRLRGFAKPESVTKSTEASQLYFRFKTVSGLEALHSVLKDCSKYAKHAKAIATSNFFAFVVINGSNGYPYANKTPADYDAVLELYDSMQQIFDDIRDGLEYSSEMKVEYARSSGFY